MILRLLGCLHLGFVLGGIGCYCCTDSILACVNIYDYMYVNILIDADMVVTFSNVRLCQFMNSRA